MRLLPTTSLSNASRAITPRLAVGLLCVVFFGFLGRDARAETCGHYLFKNGQPVAGSDRSLNADAIAAATRHQQHLPALPKAPCDGPGCRKQTLPLVPPPAAPLSVTASDPAAILDVLLSANTCVDSMASFQSETGAHWVASEVFRPPAA